MSETHRPQPVITELNRPFFDGLATGELRLQRCDACQLLRYPIASLCPNCLGRGATWETLSGRGIVHSSVVFHQVYNPAFAGEAPYNVSIVELAEGPRLMTNVVGIEPSAVRVGQAVTAVFTRIDDGAFIPQFVPEQDPTKEAS
jgi:uncharacterized OB-fold protein